MFDALSLKRPPPGTPSIRAVRMDAVALTVAARRAGRVRIAILQAGDLPQLVRVDEQIAQLRIERRPAPVDAAVVAGELHAQAVVARPAGTGPPSCMPSMSFLHAASSSGVTVAMSAADIVMRESGGGLSGNGCVFDVALERHFALRHRPLLDAVDRLAGHAIEQEQQSDLVDRGHGGNGPAALLHVDQRRRAGQIGVPDVVMHDLEVPQVLAGVRVGRDEAGAEQVVARAVAAVLVDRRRAERHVDDAALRRRR